MSQPQVIPVMKNWQVKLGVGVSTGRRVYIDASALPAQTPVSLPLIGSYWGAAAPLLTCKTCEITYLADRPQCPVLYTLDYDSTPLTAMELFGSLQTIPISADISAQFDTFSPPMDTSTGLPQGNITWGSDGAKNASARIPQRVLTESITLSRYIYGTDLGIFHTRALWPCVNKVNAAAFQQGHGGYYPGYTSMAIGAQMGSIVTQAGTIPDPSGLPSGSPGFAPGTVLFLGCRLEQQVSQSQQMVWRADMQFQVRCVPDGSGNTDPTAAGAYGWNYEFRTDTLQYDKMLLNGNPLYASADFGLLFATGLPVITNTQSPTSGLLGR